MSAVLFKSPFAVSGSIIIGTTVSKSLSNFTPDANNIVNDLITLEPVPPIPKTYNFAII